MVQNTPKVNAKGEAKRKAAAQAAAPARVALIVLALCFTLSVFGRGLGESFTVFLIHDANQSYNPLLAFALASAVLGMVAFLVVPALRR
jgi:hypothetical protein